MSVKADPFPTERAMLAALDNGARQAMEQAKRPAAAAVLSETPRGRTGATAAALAPRTQRTATGQTLVIAPPRGARHPSGPTIAQVVRWVNRGTGTLREGPGSKAPIHSPRLFPYGARMILPGGAKRLFVKGQAANPFMERIFASADPKVLAIVNAAAQAASDAAAGAR